MRRKMKADRTTTIVVLAALATLWCSTTAFAQLDPLLFLKRVPPTVIIVFDTSLRMLEDGSGNFYDPNFYSTTDDPAVMAAFPTIDPSTTRTYRRVFQSLSYNLLGSYTTDRIRPVAAVWDPADPLTSNSPADVAFLDPTRYSIARSGVTAALVDNAGSTFRWGLLRLRQSSPAWRLSPGCARPVFNLDSAQDDYQDSAPCAAGGIGRYGIYAPSVAAASYLQASAPAGTLMVPPAANTSNSILTILTRPVGDNAGLIPAGIGGNGFDDRPINLALIDARQAAINAMAADSAANRSCRNTVVVLITSGKDDGDLAYNTLNNPATTASTFLSVTSSGVTKRVPIYVVGVRPPAADEAELQAIATNSGGVYRHATSSNDVAAAINAAVQAGFSRAADFDSGKTSEFTPVSPIVGTVNLKDALSASGVALPDTDIVASPGGQALPQRSNVLITAGFALPGFDGRIRAFRTYKPEADGTKPTGWKFVNDGTPLWPDLDGRPQLAGQARTPADPDSRNIYTCIPSGSGDCTRIAFSAANAATLAAHLNVADAASLISLVRSQPLGAVIGSTPALMDPPSLDPPPDDDYGRNDAAGTFAGDYKDRRPMIFVGANDGMIHAIDARTGYEVWAFIPYNLLPKLRTLQDGQPVEQFDYFVDSSPKIAEVKLNGDWRSMLIIGQGQGGTFYQAFDVTEAGMGVAPAEDGITAVTALLARFDSPDESIQFSWAFPNYTNFDPTYTATFPVFDGTPGGRVKIFGDLKGSATYVEKTVGLSWSDPAVGPLTSDRSLNAVIVGSGYFPAIEDSLPGRGVGAPRAGTAFYLIDAETGSLIGNPSGGSCAGTGCISVGDVAANGRKNGLQADPSAAGENGTHMVKKAYLGDIDGRYWRFNFDDTGALTNSLMVDTGAPIYASSALLFVGSADVYMFFATGSDILSPTSPGGTGVFRLYGLKDNSPGSGATTRFAIDLATVSASGSLITGERPSTAPSVAGDIVFYTTTVESAAAPCSDVSSKLYAVTYAGGAAYDSDGSGKIEGGESQVARTLAGRATAPFIVDQHLYLGTTGAEGAMVEAFGDPEDFNNGIGQVGVRILSWREIR
jgi:Neisseria PilC beta-propeller domain/von Willebrand factor type A domain